MFESAIVLVLVLVLVIPRSTLRVPHSALLLPLSHQDSYASDETVAFASISMTAPTHPPNA